MVSVSEYVENIHNIKLIPSQKGLLDSMEKIPKDVRVVYGRGGKSYICVVKEKKKYDHIKN